MLRISVHFCAFAQARFSPSVNEGSIHTPLWARFAATPARYADIASNSENGQPHSVR
jgi:hypothetical protein